MNSTIINNTFILMLGAMILSGCNIQYGLLYFPSAAVPSEKMLSADNLRFWPSSVRDYRGLVSGNEVRDAKGTVIVFHGNGGTAVDRLFYMKALGALGYRVILAEYPAYGGRKGELGEESFVNDARETVRIAFEEYGGPIILLGESLGCGVAAAVAGDTSVKIDAIVLITPWDTLLSVAKSHFPFLPVKMFLKDKYDNVGNLKSFEGRIAVVAAGRDRVIPVRHASDLYDSLPGGAKRMWTIKGAGHNDWPGFMDMALWKEIMDFVSQNDSSFFLMK